MDVTDAIWVRGRISQPSLVGVVSVLVLVVLSAIGVIAGVWNVVVVSWVGFVAMSLSILPGTRTAMNADRLVWGYGLSSGAMVTSAAVFLVPEALGYSPSIGGFGIAAGLLVGFGAHTIGHRLSHLDGSDTTAAQLTAHSLADGVIVGLVYAAAPDLGLLLGLGVISHKGPAGYAAARRLSRAGKSASVLLLPAAGVGLAALPVALINPPESPIVNAAIFGFATGIFLHIAMDFLPECEVGSEIGTAIGQEESADIHAELDRLRVHAVVSTILGASAVALAWVFLTNGVI